MNIKIVFDFRNRDTYLLISINNYKLKLKQILNLSK